MVTHIKHFTLEFNAARAYYTSPKAASNSLEGKAVTPEERFEDVLLARLAEAEALLGYRFSGLRKLIAERGAFGAACHLLAPANTGHPYAGFTVFVDGNMLRCSVEQTVLDFSEAGLFAAPVIATAKLRLLIASRKIKRLTEAQGDPGSSPSSATEKPMSEPTAK